VEAEGLKTGSRKTHRQVDCAASGEVATRRCDLTLASGTFSRAFDAVALPWIDFSSTNGPGTLQAVLMRMSVIFRRAERNACRFVTDRRRCHLPRPVLS